MSLLVVAALVAGVGATLLVRSRAATQYANIETENSTIAGNVSKVSDTSASGGQAIKFGSATAASSGFTHPGILVNKAKLDFVKSMIVQGKQPWAKLYADMKASSLASLSYAASPVAQLDCPTNTDASCKAQTADGQAAYIDALIWYYSGNDAYAQKSVQILNKWAATLKSSSTANNNNYLYAAWAADVFPRAAEIMRTYNPPAGEAGLNVSSFSTMLTNAWLPLLKYGTPEMASSAGNWDLAMTEGLMNIGIFTDNRAVFNQGVSRWQARTPAYVYLTSDNGGNGIPNMPPNPSPGYYDTNKKIQCLWLNYDHPVTTCNSTNLHLFNGQTEETCRDYIHAAMGMAALYDAAETARIQQVDLWGQQSARLMAGLEANARLMNTDQYPGNNECSVASSAVSSANIVTMATYVIAYNEYAIRLGHAAQLPEAAKTVQRVINEQTSRPANYDMMVWEALTDYNAP